MTCSRTLEYEPNDPPTRPGVKLFDLRAETSRMDVAAAAFDSERTVSLRPEENARLLASAATPTDDDLTLVAPAPTAPLALTLDRPARSPAPRRAVVTVGVRATPERAHLVRDDRGAAWMPRGATETWIVAGIWVMALSLLALLALLATAA
jgi:hypothetical protein